MKKLFLLLTLILSFGCNDLQDYKINKSDATKLINCNDATITHLTTISMAGFNNPIFKIEGCNKVLNCTLGAFNELHCYRID